MNTECFKIGCQPYAICLYFKFLLYAFIWNFYSTVLQDNYEQEKMLKGKDQDWLKIWL